MPSTRKQPETKHKTTEKKSLDFPVLFYQSVRSDQSVQPDIAALFAPADIGKRRLLMWSGVIIVMAFLIVFWGATLKERIKAEGLSADKDSLFQTGKNELSGLLQKNSQTFNQLADIKSIFQQAASAASASHISNVSKNGAVEKLKKKIEQKYPE